MGDSRSQHCLRAIEAQPFCCHARGNKVALKDLDDRMASSSESYQEYHRYYGGRVHAKVHHHFDHYRLCLYRQSQGIVERLITETHEESPAAFFASSLPQVLLMFKHLGISQ